MVLISMPAYYAVVFVSHRSFFLMFVLFVILLSWIWGRIYRHTLPLNYLYLSIELLFLLFYIFFLFLSRMYTKI